MSAMFFLFGRADDAPQLSFGEIMDRLFDLWLTDGSTKTFEEFCA